MQPFTIQKRSFKVVCAVVFAVLALSALSLFGPKVTKEVYRVFDSPDRRFQVIVFRHPTAMTMPGQSGDAPGLVVLVEAKNGRELKRQKIEMVQLIEELNWSTTNVDIKFLANWSLPK